MRINDKQIKELQILLLNLTGKEYSPEETQAEGLQIIRFVYAKKIHTQQLNNREIKDENESQ